MDTLKDLITRFLNVFKIWIIVQPWEQGLRVRFGKWTKVLKGGIYFRLPYADSLYIQSVRLRVISMPMQTVTSRDGHTITLTGAIGYSITDIGKMYNRLYQPELSLTNIVMSQLADVIYKNEISQIKANEVEASVLKVVDATDYGIKIEYFTMTNFAVVKTYRLIQDHSWVSEGMRLDEKVK